MEITFGNVTIQFPSKWSDSDGGEVMYKIGNGHYQYLTSMMEYEADEFTDVLSTIFNEGVKLGDRNA